jgi:predicted nucleotidyltransferase
MPSPSRNNRSIRETVTATLAEHPVSVGFLFGSRARGEAYDQSDVDVAVAFEDTSPRESSHVDAHLALGADLVLALGTDDVSLIDLHAASQPLVRVVLRDGDRLVGTNTDVRRLREAILDDADRDPQSPAERFDDALAAIDDHLG